MEKFKDVRKVAYEVISRGEMAVFAEKVKAFKVNKGSVRSRIVRIQREGERLVRHLVFKERGKQINSATYTLKLAQDELSAHLSVEAIPYNRSNLYTESSAAPTLLQLLAGQGESSGLDVVKRFSHLQTNLVIQDSPERILEIIKNKRILVSTKKEDLSSLYLEIDGGNFVCLYGVVNKEEVIPRENFFDGEKVKDGYILYLDPEVSGYESLTAGDIKGYKIPMIAQNLKENFLEEFLPEGTEWPEKVTYMEALKYVLTYGCSHLIQDSPDDEGNMPEASLKDIADGNNRISLWSAPQSACGPVRTYGLYMGKVKAPSGGEYADGGAYLSSSYISSLFTVLSGGRYRFTEKAVEGCCLQCRPYTSKVLAEVSSRGYIEEFIKSPQMGNPEVVYLERGKITDEVLKDLNACIKGKGKVGPYAGKLVVICDDEVKARKIGIDYVTDLNGHKSVNDFTLPTSLNVLEVSHGHAPHDEEAEEEGFGAEGARTSTQMLQTLLVANFTKTVLWLVKLFVGMLTSKKVELLSEESRAPHKADFDQENPAWSQILASMLPWFGWKYYFPLYKTSANMALRGLTRAISRLNINVQGIHAFVRMDYAMDFGVNLLKCGVDGDGDGTHHWVEVVCPAISQKYAFGIKYPKMHFREFGKFKVISIEEYISRVSSNEVLTARQKELLIEKIKNVSCGSILLPAYEIVKNMLAGLDIDGDSMIVYTDPEVIDIIKDFEPAAVNKPDAPNA